MKFIDLKETSSCSFCFVSNLVISFCDLSTILSFNLPGLHHFIQSHSCCLATDPENLLTLHKMHLPFIFTMHFQGMVSNGNLITLTVNVNLQSFPAHYHYTLPSYNCLQIIKHYSISITIQFINLFSQLLLETYLQHVLEQSLH